MPTSRSDYRGQHPLAMLALAAGLAFSPLQAEAAVSASPVKWHPMEVTFAGPEDLSETTASPKNPFLDYRLMVTFTAPDNRTYHVPGYFDGNGTGGALGRVWKAKFAPDAAGTWRYTASFRSGGQVAISTASTAGSALGFNGETGTFTVADRNASAPGFLKHGRLEYVGRHHLKFRDGPYFIKTACDSPENFLGYYGFDNTPNAMHRYDAHLAHWVAGDPDWNAGAGKRIIGALNYISGKGMNAIYLLPMNIGGDGRDTWPYVGPIANAGSVANDNLHFDLSKLRQWDVVFAHAQRKGIHLHVVLSEAEAANKDELDGGTLGVERKLFYREMVARFGHHLALQWNLCEEYDFKKVLSPQTIKEWAAYLSAIDPYGHPVTVHQMGNPDSTWTPFLGNADFDLTSFQYAGSVVGYGAEVEEWRTKSANAGRPIPICMDEVRTLTTSNAAAQRMEILWPTLLSGGHLEWYVGGADQNLENFTHYEAMWTYTRIAREFMEQHLPFAEMVPSDALVTGEATLYNGAQVLAKAGDTYAVYLPDGTPSGSISLAGVSGSFTKRWFDPRAGVFAGTIATVNAGGAVALGTPPSAIDSDWVVLLERSGTGNVAPTVVITTPANGATVPPGSTITITASASDTDGSVAKVEFFAGTVKLGEDATTPYAVTWSGAANGGHTLRAVVIDNLGASASAQIGITVGSSTPTTPTVVSLTLINATANTPIAGRDPLVSGSTIDLATLPSRSLSLRANVSGPVESVRFVRPGGSTLVEGGAPYAAYGDASGDYHAWNPGPGTYTFTATAYPSEGAAGTAGPMLTVTFTLVDSGATASTAELGAAADTSAGGGGCGLGSSLGCLLIALAGLGPRRTRK